MQFDAHKAVAAIGYLVRLTRADLYSVLKMIYLADKEHLGRFGRTITGDEYAAMAKGPVPERSYELCKFIRGDRAYFDPLPDAREKLSLRPAPRHDFELLEEPDLSQLSRSDLQCLEATARTYCDGRGWREVADASHDDAWKAAWAAAEARGIGSTHMDILAIAATLPNASDLIEHLVDSHPGEAAQEECMRSLD